MVIPDSEEIIKNLLKLGNRKVEKRKDRIRFDLDARGKVAFLHKKLRRAQLRVPVRRRSRLDVTGKVNLKTSLKKKTKKIRIVPKKKSKRTSQ